MAEAARTCSYFSNKFVSIFPTFTPCKAIRKCFYCFLSALSSNHDVNLTNCALLGFA